MAKKPKYTMIMQCKSCGLQRHDDSWEVSVCACGGMVKPVMTEVYR